MNHGNISPEIARGLLALQKRIEAANMPVSMRDKTIKIATWNIRKFGSVPRTPAALHYIAEILGQFNFISIMEMGEGLTDLNIIMQILGPDWHIAYTNLLDENKRFEKRIGYLFDKRSVKYKGQFPRGKTPKFNNGAEDNATRDFMYSRVIRLFRSGNFDFAVMASPCRWGTVMEGRKWHLRRLAKFIDNRFKPEDGKNLDLILIGDFNIPLMDKSNFKALTGKGLQIPDTLRNLKYEEQVIQGSNPGENLRFDQILHFPTTKERFTNTGGVLDFFGNDEMIKELFPSENYTRQTFSYQLSHQFPLWMQVNVDVEGGRLEQIAKRMHRNA